MKTLLLSEKIVKQLLDMDEVIDAVESAFCEKALGHVQMPAKPYLFYHKYNGDLRVMPSYIEGIDTSVVKIVNVHPDNPEKYRLPTIMAILIIIDPKSGAPLAIMGGAWVTAMRTGAASGVATKYLARKDSRTLGIIGAGVQARTQLIAIAKVRGIKEVYVYDRDIEKAQKYAEEMSESLGINIVPVGTIEKAVKSVDILTTVTPSKEPIIKNDWINEGTHINAIGADAPGKEELDPIILKRAKIIVDCYEQASHGGEINVPLANGVITMEKIWCELGEVCAGLKLGRSSLEEITIFDSTGLAIQDAATARLVYDKALAKNYGYMVEFI